jgi:beta-glucanase (GH16 family)
VSFPGNNIVGGFWPGIWTFGNLGRAGYTGTTDGVRSRLPATSACRFPSPEALLTCLHSLDFAPADLAVSDFMPCQKYCRLLTMLRRYTYDSCDTGILPNQTWSNGTGPWPALNSGGGGSSLSYLPGHRWASCTCPGYEDEHPGPNINTGRNVPEIDLVEAQIEVSRATGQVSQSFQVAPFNGYYKIDNATIEVQDETLTSMNSYWGGQYQQAASCLTDVNSDYYRDNSDDYGVFAFEMMGTNHLCLDFPP